MASCLRVRGRSGAQTREERASAGRPDLASIEDDLGVGGFDREGVALWHAVSGAGRPVALHTEAAATRGDKPLTREQHATSEYVEDLTELVESPEGFSFLPRPIPPSQSPLVRTDIEPPDEPDEAVDGTGRWSSYAASPEHWPK